VVRNIPAGQTVEFPLVTRIQARSVDGELDADNFHVCVTVRIKDYTTSINGVDYREITTSNNAAQSNYSRFITGESSPANVDQIPILVKNTLDEPAFAAVHASATHSEYQFFQSEPVFLLQPGEARLVRIGIQYDTSHAWANAYKGYTPGPQARVLFKGMLFPVRSGQEFQQREGVPIDLGGAGGIVFGGGKVVFKDIVVTKGYISGRVLRKNTDHPIPGGYVMAIGSSTRLNGAPTCHVDPEGRFEISGGISDDKVELHFFPSPGMPYTPFKTEISLVQN